MIDKEIFTKFDKELDKSMLPFSISKVKKWKSDLIYLQKLIDGVAESSYGIEVAKMAGFLQVRSRLGRIIQHNLYYDTFMAILQPQIIKWNEVMLLSLDYIKCSQKVQILMNVLIQQ